METPGNEEPSPTEPPAAPLPPPSAAPRPLTGPTTSAIPVEAAHQGGIGGDWPAQATDAIVNVVGTVRDRTTGPITTIARGIVFGVFAGALGIVVAVMLIIAAIRLLNAALPSGVWLAYLVLGLVFVLAGALVFRKRNQPAAPAGNTGAP